MLFPTKRVAHLGTLVVKHTQSGFLTFAYPPQWTSVVIRHQQSKKLWFSHAAKWGSKCLQPFPGGIAGVTLIPEETRFCLVSYLKCGEKKSNWAERYWCEERVSASETKKGVREIQ